MPDRRRRAGWSRSLGTASSYGPLSPAPARANRRMCLVGPASAVLADRSFRAETSIIRRGSPGATGGHASTRSTRPTSALASWRCLKGERRADTKSCWPGVWRFTWRRRRAGGVHRGCRRRWGQADPDTGAGVDRPMVGDEEGGARAASRSWATRSATLAARWVARSAIESRNSSPPWRASRSSARNARRSGPATSPSDGHRWSSVSWPCASLMALNATRSMNSSAVAVPVRRPPPGASLSAERRPVSASR